MCNEADPSCIHLDDAYNSTWQFLYRQKVNKFLFCAISRQMFIPRQQAMNCNLLSH